MQQQHKIQKVRFDIRFSSKAVMLAEQSAISATIRERLMPALDAVLSAHASNGSHIRIERLQIDLGRIHYDDFKSEMERRTRERLNAVLQEKIASLKVRPDAKEGIMPLPLKHLGELEHFLVTGTLPWSAAAAARDIDQRLQIVLKQTGRSFIDFLRSSPYRTQVLQRFVRQFPEAGVKQVIRELTADRAEQVFSEIEGLLKVLQGASLGDGDDSALKTLVWECVLESLLENRKIALTAGHFLKWAAGRMEKVPGLSRSRFRQLKALVETDLGPTGRYPIDCVTESRPEDVAAVAASRWIIRGYDRYADLHRFLEQGVGVKKAARTSGKIALWDVLAELHSRHSEQFMRLVRDMARQPSLCERICAGLPKQRIWMLIEAILADGVPYPVQEASAVLKAIKGLVDRSAGCKVLYADILHRIAGGRPLDRLTSDSRHRAETPTGEIKDKTQARTPSEGAHAGKAQPEKVVSPVPGKEETAHVLDYLAGRPLLSPLPPQAAKYALEQLVLQENIELLGFMADHLKDKDVTLRWVRLLSGRGLTRVLARLKPSLHAQIQSAGDIVVTAAYSAAFFDRPEELYRLKWEFIFTDPAVVGKIRYNRGDFVRRFVVSLAGRTHQRDTGALRELLIRNLTRFHQPSSRPEIQAVLYELEHMPAQTSDAVRQVIPEPPEPKSTAPPQPMQMLRMRHPGLFREESDVIESAAVDNAGVVIAAPYLPRLWKMLGLTEDAQFIDRSAAERAVHLLQFMVDARTRTPEYELVLNKILCGLEISEPICPGIYISDSERETIEGLIRGMIANWKTIGSTSLTGFRVSFLQRRGRLVLKENGWHLKVASKAFDMLLDRIPWSFSTIKHAWMEKVVFVSWR